MMRLFRHLSLLALLALLGAFAPLARPALAITLSVTNTGDSGAGSLRQAIIAANATPPGEPVTIVFAIPQDDPGADPGGYWMIQPAEQLPALARGNITIDGSTQPNGRAEGPKIVLDGGIAPQNGINNKHGLVLASAGNTVKGLVIDHFVRAIGLSEESGGAGVYIAGPGATGNRVAGCYIGIEPGGTGAARNSGWGVLIDDGASDNWIGGVEPGDRNVIAGNGQANVAINQVAPNSTRVISGNHVLGNYIGTNAAGSAVIGGEGNSTQGNPSHGVVLGAWAQNNVVGGTTPAERNVIAGHNASSNLLSAAGVNVASQSTNANNVIAGNYIGTDAAGTTAIPNAIGVRVGGASGTVVGGTAAGARNIISGNSGPGVLVTFGVSTNTTVAGNWIGLGAAGNPLGNHEEGVRVHNGATATTIGPSNVISANGSTSNPDGLLITNPNTHDNIVAGNFIGTDKDGMATSAALASLRSNVRIDDGAYDNRIGGLAGAERNVIAARDEQAGIAITGAARANRVQGNYIGVNVLGTGALSQSPPVETSRGIWIDGAATDNTIGGAAAEARNVISANGIGVEIAGAGTTGNRVAGNFIGADRDGQPLGNRQYGILLRAGATNNTLGGNATGEGNLVAHNSGDGIRISGAGAQNNLIAGDVLASNTGNGVVVSSATAITITQTETRNNGGDGIALEFGGNNGILPPASLQVSGATFSGIACAGCVVEVFTSPARQDGEGPRYLTRTTASGSGDFSVNAAGCDSFLTATARDAAGNTSAFAPMVENCVSPQPGVQFSPGVPASSAGAPVIVAPGATVVYTHTLINNGGLAGTFTITRTSTQGWASQPGPTSVLLAPGESRTIAITVAVPLDALAGTVERTTVIAATGDRSQSQSDYTQVEQVYGVTIEPDHTGEVTPTSAYSVSIDYTHIITNTGNSTDTITLSETHTAISVTVSFPAGNTCVLPAHASCTRTVRVTFAPGSRDTSDTTTVTATSAGGASDQATDTTTIAQAAVPLITPDRATREVEPISTTVVFTHTVTNIGAISGTITMTVQAEPPGWSVVLSPTESFQLAPDASREVTLTVTVPDGAPAGPHDFILRAAAPTASAIATDTVVVTATPGLLFAPNHSGAADPGATVTYTHTLTNTGNSTDSFTITLETSPGWSAAVTPTIVTDLAAGAARTVTVTVTAPTGIIFDSTGTVTATATSALPPHPHASVIDVTTLNAKVGAELLPSERTVTVTGVISGPGAPAFTQILTHTLRNSGSISGTFTISATSAPLDWASVVTPTEVMLEPGETATITVGVTVPAGTPPGASNVVTVEVRQRGGPGTILATARDTIVIRPQFVQFLPLVLLAERVEPPMPPR